MTQPQPETEAAGAGGDRAGEDGAVGIGDRLHVVVAVDEEAFRERQREPSQLLHRLVEIGVEVRLAGRDRLDAVLLDHGALDRGWLTEHGDEEGQLRSGSEASEPGVAVPAASQRVAIASPDRTAERERRRGRAE